MGEIYLYFTIRIKRLRVKCSVLSGALNTWAIFDFVIAASEKMVKSSLFLVALLASVARNGRV